MKKNNIILVSILVSAVAVSMTLTGEWNESDHSKYIKFSHTFHVKDQGIACEDCHIKAKESKLSSDKLIGDHESCKSCHEEQISGKCDLCHVDPQNIVPIERPERTVTFSHELHAAKRGVKCEICHAGLDRAVYASSDNMPQMSVCMNCHASEKVSTYCEGCHSDLAALIPADHRQADFRKDHKRLTRVGEQDVTCATCHTESFCQDCHSGAELKGFGSNADLTTEPFPRTPLRDSPRDTKLQQVHTLNYRFTHGIDARSKRTDCFSCHEQQTFCAPCHEAGGNITQKKIKPATHNGAGFTTLGQGSGGGRHAELARRDIETCASCHDIQGADPTCMLCHKEGGGVR